MFLPRASGPDFVNFGKVRRSLAKERWVKPLWFGLSDDSVCAGHLEQQRAQANGGLGIFLSAAVGKSGGCGQASKVRRESQLRVSAWRASPYKVGGSGRPSAMENHGATNTDLIARDYTDTQRAVSMVFHRNGIQFRNRPGLSSRLACRWIVVRLNALQSVCDCEAKRFMETPADG